MKKLNVLLLLAVLASSLLLVHTAYESRLVFTALDRAQRDSARLEAEHTRLAAERQTQATHQKVARVAGERLKMTAPAATLYVNAPGTEPERGLLLPGGGSGEAKTAVAANGGTALVGSVRESR